MRNIVVLSVMSVLFMTSSYTQTVNYAYSTGMGSWGFVRSDGVELTKDIFRTASSYSSDGYATGILKNTNDAVLIDSMGNFVDLKLKGITHLEYLGENEENIDHKTAIFRIGKKFGVVNMQGKIIHNCEYDKIDNVKSSFTIGKKGSSLFILNLDGSAILLDKDVVKVNDFHEGKASFVSKNKMVGFINENGEIVIKPMYKSTGIFSLGLAWAKQMPQGKEKIKVGFINEQGEWEIEPKFDMVKEFDQKSQRALVEVNDQRFYIDPSGEEIRVKHASKFGPFENGYAWAYDGRFFGFIDPEGSWSIEPQFDYVIGFENGLAFVSKGNNWGMINVNGEIIIPINYGYLGRLKNGLCVASRDRLNEKRNFVEVWYGVMNIHGHFVIEPKYFNVK